MKHLKNIAVIMFVMALSLPVLGQNKKDKKVIKDADKAVATLLKVNPDMRHYFDKSAGCVIFPNVGKGGFIVGGASGNGVLYQYGVKKGMAHLTEFNIGLEFGGEALIEVIFFETLDEVNKFKEGNFQFDAGITATAIKSGMSMDAKYKDGVAVFTHAKGGLMAEASVGGQKFKYKPFDEM